MAIVPYDKNWPRQFEKLKKRCPDRNTYAEKLRLSDLLRGPFFRSLIGSLELSEGSCGLDVGCGTGSNTLLLAEAVGGSGHVAGIDLSGELLAHAVRRAQEAGISRRTSFIKCDMNRLAFSEHAFDWAWSADCAGYAPGDPASLTENIAKLVKPGGSVLFLAWSSQQLLPGHPLLEARLNATCAGIAPFVEGQRPNSHFLRAVGWFRGCGTERNQGAHIRRRHSGPPGQRATQGNGIAFRDALGGMAAPN